MKILSIVLAALICLPISALAVPDSVVTGPYNVSFDLGFSSYDIVKDPIKNTETLEGNKYTVYSMTIYNGSYRDSGIAIIGITEFEEDQKFPTNEAAVKSFRTAYTGAATRSIDGTTGIITSSKLDNGITIYLAIYHPTFDPKRLNASVISNYPWDEGTLSLLKTIHIEKLEKSATDNRTIEQIIPTSQTFKILIDEKKDQTITTNSPLQLAEGYVLQINHIDVDGNKVYLDLLKDNKVVDSKIVSPSKDYASDEDKIYRYKKDIGNSPNVTVIEVQFKNAFQGADQALGTVSHVMQISENPDNS